MTRGQTATSFLLRPCGGWRTSLLWRGFGWYLLGLNPVLWGLVRGRLPERLDADLAVFCAGAIVLAFGARPATLALAAAAGLLFLRATLRGDGQVADEFLFEASLPGLGLLLLAAALHDAGRGPATGTAARAEAVEPAQVMLFRLQFCVAMGFAAFHKLNQDFLDPRTSCLALKQRLHDWWGLPPSFVALQTPVSIIAGEALLPLLLLLRPHPGILAAVVFLAGFGHIGPVAFAGFLSLAAFSFLEERDGACLARAFRRAGWVLAPALALGLWLSHRRYRSSPAARGVSSAEPLYSWGPYAFYQAVLILMLFAAVALLVDGLRRRPGGERGAWSRPDWRVLRAPSWTRRALAAFLVASLINGLAPYLGLKYRLSFAMLSNLRADALRWNHLLVPRAVLLPLPGPALDFEERIRHRGRSWTVTGLATRPGIERRLEFLRAQRADVELSLGRGGTRWRFEDATSDPELARLLLTLPRGRLFLERVEPGPQPCVH